MSDKGYYIMGTYTSVAWCKTKHEADTLCKKMNYSGGPYKVVKVYNARYPIE